LKLIKAEIDSFGKIEKRTIEFEDELTVIRGNNEAGKSTFASFLKYMLYGFSGKALSISDNEKKKYTPWEKGKTAGALTVDYKGEHLRIERENALRSSSKIIDTTGNSLFSGLCAGEAFYGVDEDTYVKTAFIGQLNITADKMNGMPDAIQNILFSVNESVSADTAKKKLGTYKNTLSNRMRKTGKIYELEEKLALLEQKRDSYITGHKELLSAEFSLGEVREKKKFNLLKLDKLASEKYNIECFLATQKLKEIERAFEKATRAKTNLDNAKSKLEHNGFMPSSEYTESISVACAKLAALNGRIKDAKSTLENAKAEYDFSYSGNEKIKNLAKQFQDNGTELDPAAVIAEFSDLSLAYRKKRTTAILFTILILTIPVAILLFSQAKKIKLKIEELLNSYFCKNADELKSLLSAYPVVVSTAKKAFYQYTAAGETMKKEQAEYDAQWKDFISLLGKITETVSPYDNIDEKTKDILIKIKADLSFLEDKKSQYSIAKAEYDTLVKENNVENLSVCAKSYTGNVPERELALVNRDILFYEKENEALNIKETSFDKQTGILTSTLPKPSELESEINLIKEELIDFRLKNEAFELAIGTIDEACNEIKNEVSPKLTKRASELFQKLTNGKYESLTVDSNMSLCFLEKDTSITREIDYLSAGTVDLAYLSLRIALADYLYAEKPTLTFDDAFVKIDDTRLEKMLNLLCELKKEYQIILFSCHDREAELLKGHAKIINL